MAGAPHRNARAWLALVLGAVSLGTGLAWMLAAGWGVAPLDAFIAGTSELTGLTVGTVIIAVSLFFLVGSWFLGSRPGWGTLIAFVGVGAVVDLWNLVVFDLLGWDPALWVIAPRIGLWTVGFALFALGYLAVDVTPCLRWSDLGLRIPARWCVGSRNHRDLGSHADGDGERDTCCASVGS